MKLDLIVIAAHPDDAEICVGGTLLKLAAAGRKVGVVDLTRGEMGTRGSRDERDRETRRASEFVGLAARENLELPDGRVEVTLDARERLAKLLRLYQPDLVLAHHVEDLHPDHAACGRLAREAWYLSGLQRLAEQDGGPAAARPKRLLHFAGHVPFEASFVVDVGAVWEKKLELVRCYESQHAPRGSSDRGQHFLFGADILSRMETRARFYGERVGVRYGEPLLHVGPFLLGDVELLR